jgi:hypothetical protein
VTIFLTDAPDDLAHVWLNITQIYLQGGPSGDGRTIVFDGPTGRIDVLELIDDALLLVENAPVLAGRYAQLRVVIGEIVIETEGGQVFATSGADIPEGLSLTGTIVCPSCSSSGFKVLLQNKDLALLEDATLTLDFDAAETFAHRAGNSNRWIVHPTIKLSDFVTVDE